MLRNTPLKKSKFVNKPFQSPFDPSKLCKKTEPVKNTPEKPDFASSPVSSRPVQVKKNLLLTQKQKENFLEFKNDSDVKTDEKVDEPLRKKRRILNTSKNESPIIKQSQKPLLLTLKRRVFEKRQELDCLKSRNRCAKKHNPEVLKASIKKWKTACQDALEEVCGELNRQDASKVAKISDVLSMLNIPATLVGYSIENDAFD